MRLHLRARGIPAFAAGLLIVAVLAAISADWLTSRPGVNPRAALTPVFVLAPLLAALLLGPTLGGADEFLEGSLTARWPLIRAGHVLLATTAVAVLLGAAAPSGASIRNTLGCVGLVAGAAALIGARLAWLPAFVYVCAAYAAGPARDGGWEEVWAWPVQLSSAEVSWVTALVTFVTGTALHIRLGARPNP